MLETAKTIFNFTYPGRSMEIKDEENQNKDFRAGYGVGLISNKIGDDSWMQAWEDYGKILSKEWEEWKTGYWAARWTKLK